MELIARIRQAGFAIALEGENIRLEYAGQCEPPEEAKALLDTLRERKGEAIAYLKEAMPKPYMETDWGLVIPFDSNSRYHWWAGGQTIETTEREFKKTPGGQRWH